MLTDLQRNYKTTNSLQIVEREGQKFVAKCYRTSDAEKSCDRERFVLNHWKHAGYPVPQIQQIDIPELNAPYLVMSFIEGPTLRGLLRSASLPVEEKLQILTRFFDQTSRRHHRAVIEADPDLIHYDPNSGNVICANEKFYTIDFETRPRRGSITKLVGIEITRMSRWIVRDMGIEHMEIILTSLVRAYQRQLPSIRHAVKRTINRPFQFYHRRKNKKIKIAHPSEVTKYDIADTLARLCKEPSITGNPDR